MSTHANQRETAPHPVEVPGKGVGRPRAERILWATLRIVFRIMKELVLLAVMLFCHLICAIAFIALVSIFFGGEGFSLTGVLVLIAVSLFVYGMAERFSFLGKFRR